RDVARKTRGQDGFAVLLSCRALSSPTTCRFIPALDVLPRNRRLASCDPLGLNLLLRHTDYATTGESLAEHCGYVECLYVSDDTGQRLLLELRKRTQSYDTLVSEGLADHRDGWSDSRRRI